MTEDGARFCGIQRRGSFWAGPAAAGVSTAFLKVGQSDQTDQRQGSVGTSGSGRVLEQHLLELRRDSG